MQRNQLLILFVAATSIVLLLAVGVDLLVNSNNGGTSGMMPGSPTSTNNGTVALVLISAAVIILIAIVLFFVFPKKEKTQFTPQDFREVKIEASISGKIITKQEPERPFDVFLCYKKSSGRDYADHLKSGLEELGLHTFEDCRDIPQTVDTQEGWACVRDKALEQSKFFVLIMTPGFELSSEVIKEISMARKQGNKTFVFFRHRSMGRNILVNLGDEVLDIGKLEQVSFESKEELLRLAHNILLKK